MRLSLFFFFFFFNDTATTEIYTLPLHDALPILLGDLGVLHDVVQQRRHHGLRVELPVGDDLRDRHRMRDVGMAAQPELPLMRGVAELVGFLDAADVARLKVAEVLPEIGDGDGGHVSADGRPPRRFAPPLLKKGGNGVRIHPVWTRVRYSTPTLPAAISGNRMTVGLS